MSGIPASQIDGLVAFTQDKLIKRGAFLNLMTDLSEFVAIREIWDNRKKKFDGGLDWRFDAITDQNHSARVVGLYEQDGSNIADAQVSGKVGPRYVNAHYTYDVREPALQGSDIMVVDYVMSKYVRMMQSFYELLEEILWSKPTDSTDLLTPFGVAYWITKSATEGFYGVDPTGFTDGRAGISSTTYPRWANWTAQYVSVSKSDLIKKMRKAHQRTKFRSPMSVNEPKLGSMKNGIYGPGDVLLDVASILEQNNMSLGVDVASQDGRAVFKGTPLTYVPKLDDDSTLPIYMIDWNWMAVGVVDGWEQNLSKPAVVPGKHTVRRVDLDASLNMVCTNLRRQAVFSKA